MQLPCSVSGKNWSATELLITVILIGLLAVLLLGFIVLPLVSVDLVDPLPDFRDPVMVDLEEERDALLRAIHELDDREDLQVDRREQLRVRYEAKAAKVLQALDQRKLAESAKPVPVPVVRPRRVPWGAIGLAGFFVVSATLLSTWVLPRIGPDATVTTFFQDQVDAGRQIRDLQQDVERDPSTENLLALADAWWNVDDGANAGQTYLEAIEAGGDVPALAYRRLGLLTFERDPVLARDFMVEASQLDPTDTETLFFLGELNFAFGDYGPARAAFAALLPLEDDADVLEHAEARLELLDRVEPLLASAAVAEPAAADLLALADAFWDADEQERAVDVYFRILTEVDPLEPTALARTGQLLFLGGRVDDAVMLLDRAVELGSTEPQALLFLGNGQFSSGNYAAAVTAWEQYLTVVSAEEAGRVPGLISEAEARLAGEQPAEVQLEMPVQALAGPSDPHEQGRQLFTANCASCHAPGGTGGSGPALVGNPRAANAANVSSLIRFGRGLMPGFNATLSAEEIQLLVDFVTAEFGGV